MIIREAMYDDVPDIARVHVDTWQKTYRGIMPDEYLRNLSYQKRENSWGQIFRKASEKGYFIYVAQDELGKVVGFANGGLEREGNLTYRGELNAIYILKNYQRKGIGRCLFQTSVEKLHRTGIDSILVWVLAKNPACQFYEALGGQRIDEKQIARGGTKLTEVAYGWLNTASVINLT
ncbi:MAG: GNAT family N-acetyltransferase [Cyanobacteria bacterium P01_G01_bin.49]